MLLNFSIENRQPLLLNHIFCHKIGTKQRVQKCIEVLILKLKTASKILQTNKQTNKPTNKPTSIMRVFSFS